MQRDREGKRVIVAENERKEMGKGRNWMMRENTGKIIGK